MKIIRILTIVFLAILIYVNFFWTQRPSFKYEAGANVDRGYSENLKNVEPKLDVNQENLPKLEIENDPNKPSILGNQVEPNSGGSQPAGSETDTPIENPDEDSPIEVIPAQDYFFDGARGGYDENNEAYNF